jgi:hypothetical protein
LLSFVLGPLTSVRAADLSVTAGNVVASKDAKLKSGIAGATITAGQIVYLRYHPEHLQARRRQRRHALV